MTKQVLQRYKNVKADNADDFALKLDEAIRTLKINEQPQIDRNIPYLAHIFYLEEITVPESIKEEYEVDGKKFYCSDCPHFTKPEDGRKKHVLCGMCKKYVEVNTEACDWFYERFDKGLIEVVKNE